MTTAARPTQEASCHWYSKDGTPVYEVPRATGEGFRPTTLADARKMDLLPSVTTILNVLRKPQLESWLIEQAVLAAITTPRIPSESLDSFVSRVMNVDRVQESDIAKKRGAEIHDAIEGYFAHRPSDDVWLWIEPTIKFLEGFGSVKHCEHIVIGDGYAGKCDLILIDSESDEWIIDFKTTKASKLPKESYWEHKMQTAAYLACCGPDAIRHANIYISTVEQGKFVFNDNGDFVRPGSAFSSLVNYWQIANDYHP